MAEDITTVQFQVPRGHEACAAWLQGRAPAETAALLEVMGTVVDAAAAQHTRADAERYADEVRKRMQSQIDREKHRAAQLQDDLERVQGKAAVQRAELQGEFDARVEQQRVVYEANHKNLASLLHELQQRSDAAQRALATEFRAQYDARIAALEREVEAKNSQLRDLQETTCARVETIFGSLYGNSAKKGDIGEAFVRSVHSELELGTLTHAGRVKCPGYADFMWEHDGGAGAGGRGTRLHALVEVKMSTYANATRDTHKFREDVRTAVATGAANAALYVSLVERLEGKPKMALEMAHGVPVLWVSRNAADDLSARSLVELAFVSFANVWAHMLPEDHGDLQSALRNMGVFLTDQMAECEKMEHSLKALDKAADAIRVQTAQVRGVRDRLLSNAYRFRAKECAATMHAVDVEANAALVEKLRAYYDAKKRYPRHPADIGMDADRGAFDAAVQEMKSAHCRDAALERARKKRSAEDD